MVNRIKPIEEKLEHYIPEPNSGCWLWLGVLDKDGYGVLQHHPADSLVRKSLKAHRESYRYHCKDPGELHVLHRCDTPCCINPDHVYAGFHKDNMADMVRRGRHVAAHHPSDASPHTRLTWTQVKEIRARCAAGERQKVIASAYEVGQQTVSKICLGQRW